MLLDEAKQILNKNGYLLKEDAFRNNTDMNDIYAIIEAHGWNPDYVIKKIKEHYNGEVKSIKSNIQKFYNKNFYKIPKKDDYWFNCNIESCIDELINENKTYISLGLLNFCFDPYIESKKSNYSKELAIEDDVYNKWCDKLDNALNDACKRISAKSEYFEFSKSDEGIWIDGDAVFAEFNVELKHNISNVNKEILIKELEKIITDKELNKVEYDAVSYALEAEQDL